MKTMTSSVALVALTIGIPAFGAGNESVETMSKGVVCREEGRYIGWPSLATTADGTLLAVFSGDRQWHICPSGVVQIVRSADGGKTWSEPRTIGDTPVDDRDASVHVLPDGEILVTWFNSIAYCSIPHWKKQEPRDPASLLAHCGRWCVRSRDGGKTWTKPERMTMLGSAPHGGTLLKDGSLLTVGRYTPGANNEATASCNLQTLVCCERSTDGGRTWQTLCKSLPCIQDDAARPDVFHEPHVAELPDGTLVMLIRYHGGDGCFRQSVSRDGGHTWSPMTKTTLQAGETAPHLLALSDGRLVCTYGLRDVRTKLAVGEYVAISSDAGRTWSAVDGFCLWKSPADVCQGEIGYPATVQLSDGTFYTVAYEPLKKGEKPCLVGIRWKLTAK